ncbi:uncharacterized protein LOC121635843 [Melanotaenia boesemani]|uniref:uncharacterized protein LOC121635843 n=1 Tax=Melanotaenia boesemani TaxID=1250792 RepID=UPI001C058E4B|nr:uncharacterized protein LOC121635843 [Melanotaenia boesemani]
MEAGALLLFMFTLLGASSSLSFYGDSISFMPPQRIADETFKVTFHRRQNGRSNCSAQSSFSCEGGVCSNLDSSAVLQTDEDTGQSRWCQSEGHTTTTVMTNKTTFSLQDSGCCWVSNVEGKTNWTTQAELDLGTRSDSHSINRCPVTTTVSSLRVPQNCFTRVRLLAHDPDGDEVRCRFSADASVPLNFALDKKTCTLSRSGQIQTGIHVFELMMEDFSTRNITLTYTDGTSVFRDASDRNSPPLCKVKLQFSMEVLPSILDCGAGHVQPMFLARTPSHGDVLHATVGQNFQLFAQAQAGQSQIYDFQVSGPQNMTKEFKKDAAGNAEVTLNWTPQRSDLYRLVPVCFTAETNEAQSEMRCVVIMVTRSTITQGKAIVHCSSNKMMVALERASMPDIDENFLQLRDPSCSLTSNSTHIVGSMSFNTCGTKLEDKGDFIVFKNEINSFELPEEVIIRRRTVKIDFFCEFPKIISISSYYNMHSSDYIFTESSFGSFSYTFEIFNDGNFTKKVEASAYPVQVKLLEMIYMGIQATSDLPNVTLFVDSCKATPDDNPENVLSYDLIKNGCKKDETLKVHPSGPTSFNFEVQAFKFSGNYDQVFITCSVIMCEPENPFSRCAQGCVTEPSRRRRRGLSKETSSHYITQGPLQFVGPSAAMAAEEEGDVVEKKSGMPATVNFPPVFPDTKSARDGEPTGFGQVLTSHITTVVFASGFVLSLLLMAVIVRHYNRKRRAEDRTVLIESDCEN